MKLRNDTMEVNSLLGDLKQEVTELKEQLQRWSFEEQYKRITEMVDITVDTLLLHLSFENISCQC